MFVQGMTWKKYMQVAVEPSFDGVPTSNGVFSEECPLREVKHTDNTAIK